MRCPVGSRARRGGALAAPRLRCFAGSRACIRLDRGVSFSCACAPSCSLDIDRTSAIACTHRSARADLELKSAWDLGILGFRDGSVQISDSRRDFTYFASAIAQISQLPRLFATLSIASRRFRRLQAAWPSPGAMAHAQSQNSESASDMFRHGSVIPQQAASGPAQPASCPEPRDATRSIQRLRTLPSNLLITMAGRRPYGG